MRTLTVLRAHLSNGISKGLGSIELTYLYVDVVVVVPMHTVARAIKLIPQFLHLLLGKPHSESRLDLNDDEDLTRRVCLTVDCLRRILVFELRLSACAC